jgi:hypothetical protein
MSKHLDQVYSPALRALIVARIHILSGISEELQISVSNDSIDPADVASRLMQSAILLRLLVIAEDEYQGRNSS